MPRESLCRFGYPIYPQIPQTRQKVSPYDFDLLDPAISSTGAILLKHREDVNNLVEYSIDTHTAPRAIVPSNQIDQSPEYSVNGRSLAFVSSRSGSSELWLDTLDNAPPRQLTHFHDRGQFFMLTWSPDGRSIIFSYRRGSATNLFHYDMNNGAIQQLTHSNNRNFSPVYSADGRYIYYSSNDDGNPRVWRMRADGGSNPEPMFWEAIIGFLPSNDGKWMYFASGGEMVSLIRKNLQDGSTQEIFHASGRIGFLKPIVSAKGLIWFAVAGKSTSDADVYQIDPERKTSRVVAHFKDLPAMEDSGFTVSPDGNRIIATQSQRRDSRFYLLDHLDQPIK